MNYLFNFEHLLLLYHSIFGLLFPFSLYLFLNFFLFNWSGNIFHFNFLFFILFWVSFFFKKFNLLKIKMFSVFFIQTSVVHFKKKGACKVLYFYIINFNIVKLVRRGKLYFHGNCLGKFNLSKNVLNKYTNKTPLKMRVSIKNVILLCTKLLQFYCHHKYLPVSTTVH